MRISKAITAGSAVLLIGIVAASANGQSSPKAQSDAAAAPPAPPAMHPAPTDRASYFANQDIQQVWNELEAKQVINRRALEGGTYSINIRIVKPGDAPLVHGKSADVWVVTGGSATAVTGGKLVDPQQRGQTDDFAGTSISNGVEHPLKPGDIIFVPPGVPHGFKDVKGFRAFLIRFDTK
jgi:mannose-6-phosphate isomerase-like protein (cupin superfamily)